MLLTITSHFEAPKPSGDMGYLRSETFANMDVCGRAPMDGLQRVSEGRYPVSPRICLHMTQKKYYVQIT